MGLLGLIISCCICLVLMDHADATTELNDEILHRTKKAHIGKGLRAVRRLIAGAAKLPDHSEQGFKQYIKGGDFKQALEDFYNARIENVKIYRKPKGKYDMVGTIGDRRIHLNNGGINGRPTIEIRKFKTQKNSKVSEEKGVVTDKITYDPFMD